VIESREK